MNHRPRLHSHLLRRRAITETMQETKKVPRIPWIPGWIPWIPRASTTTNASRACSVLQPNKTDNNADDVAYQNANVHGLEPSDERAIHH